MKIAVYSGSFNPMHKGHLAILRTLCKAEWVDKVYLIVSPVSPFKEGAAAPEGAKRSEAARAALARHRELSKAEVNEIELGMAPPHYTIRTLDALKEAEPGNEFILAIGADNLESFPRWKDYRRILTEYGVAVYPRKGYHRGHLRARLLKENPAYRITLLDAPLVNVSSTELRQAAAEGKDISKQLM